MLKKLYDCGEHETHFDGCGQCRIEKLSAENRIKTEWISTRQCPDHSGKWERGRCLQCELETALAEGREKDKLLAAWLESDCYSDDELKKLRGMTLRGDSIAEGYDMRQEIKRLRSELEGAIYRERYLREKLGGDYVRDMPDDIWKDVYPASTRQDVDKCDLCDGTGKRDSGDPSNGLIDCSYCAQSGRDDIEPVKDKFWCAHCGRGFLTMEVCLDHEECCDAA